MRSIPVVGVATAMWKRHELADIIFDNLARIRDALIDVIDLRLAVAGSEGDASASLARKHGFLYVEVPNEPLGAKWNAALELLRYENVDGVCIVGSDDLLNVDYFHMVAQALSQGEKLFGIDSFYVLDRFEGHMFLWMGYPPPRNEEPIGLGRFVHSNYLAALDWKLWPDDAISGLDRNMCERITQVCEGSCLKDVFICKSIAEHNIVAIDIKHVQQMWSYENVYVNSYYARIIGNPTKLIEQHFMPDIVQRVLAPCTFSSPPTQDKIIPPCPLLKHEQKKFFDGMEGKALALAIKRTSREQLQIDTTYTNRRHITFVPYKCDSYHLIKCVESYATYIKDRSMHLYLATTMFGVKSSRLPIICYSIGNIHVWRNLFRVYLMDTSLENATIALDLLRHGNVVICCKEMQDFLPNLPEGAPVFTNNIDEAIVLASHIYKNESLWNKLRNASKEISSN